MEIELFLREILRQVKFSHRSNGGDHALKFLEKVKNDGKEEVICVICKEPIVPYPAFKCSVCRLFCHVSCFRLPSFNESTFFIHFGRRHEQLIFIEELKNDEEGVVCVVCREKVEGPGYKCSADECNFQLHKSCAQLSREMHHPSHPDHILILQPPGLSPNNCNACGKSIFYHCEECDFVIDTACAIRTQVNNTDNCCQHAFVPFFRQIHFTCDACGREGTDFASFCTICRLLIHSRCAGFPRTMIISGHNHTLTLTYSLHHQVKDFNNVVCKLCGQKVKIEYAAFSCQECDFVAHLYCAKAYKRESLPEKSIDVMEKIINPGDIQYFSHPHNLILSHEEVLYDKLCDGCMHFIISAPFYNCMQCDFFLHTTCAQLPKNKKHILHQHTLTLLPVSPYLGGYFICFACGHVRHGPIYRCDVCSYDLDVQCCSIPETLKHDGHQHSLFLPAIFKNCSACDNDNEQVKDGVFVCPICDFSLCFECAILPLVVRHKYDEHLLALTYAAEENSKEYYCLICKKERDPKHWFYYCATCDFSAHPKCVQGKYPHIKFESSFKEDEYHQHPVTFVRTTEYFPPCDACGNIFDGMALECAQCNSNVHFSYWNDFECLKKMRKKVPHT